MKGLVKILAAVMLAAVMLTQGAMAQCCNGPGCASGGCNRQCPCGPACSGQGCPCGCQVNQPAAHVSVDRRHAPVVRVSASTANAGVFNVGSGTVINHNGRWLVATAAHIVRNSREIFVWINGRWLTVHVLAQNVKSDCAVLGLPDGEYSGTILATSAAQSGAAYETCGWGEGKLGHQVGQFQKMEVSLPNEGQSHPCVFVTTHVRQGDSGGALLNDRGELIGVICGQNPGYEFVTDGNGTRRVPCVPACACTPYNDLIEVVNAAAPIQATAFRSDMKRAVKQEAQAQQQTSDRLGRIESELSSQKQSTMIPVPESMSGALASTGPDAQTMELLRQHGRDIGDLRDGQASLAKSVSGIAEAVQTTNKNLAEHGTLLQRLDAAKADVAANEPNAPKAKQDLDAVKEVIKGDMSDPLVRTILLVVGGLAAGGILCLIVWNIMHGKGLMRSIADNIAAQHPNNVQAQKAAAFFDTHEDSLKAMLLKTGAGAAIAGAPGLALPTGAVAVGADVLADVKAQIAALHQKADSTQDAANVAAQAASQAAAVIAAK